MRKLASIQTVKSIAPIEGADRIELASVLGWQCVVNKGQFKAGDLAVYFEIDSFLPLREEFEFLRKSCFTTSDLLGEGFRLRTQKFRGQLSQGLLLPVSSFPELSSPSVGDDVTELLGVRKWAVRERASCTGTIIGTLPHSIPRTDETRIQAAPELLQEFDGLEYYISTKLDGSSHSIGFDENGFHVAGHNFEYGDGSFFSFIQARGYREKLVAFMAENHLKTLAIQGEFCGEGIQGNRLKLSTPEWFVFTVIINEQRVRLDQMLGLCELLGMAHVPIEETGSNLSAKFPDVDAILKRAEGEYPNGGKKEGIVIRPVIPVHSSLIGGPLSFKAVNNKYLLKA